MTCLVTTVPDLRVALAGDAPGLVPTMGALHAGHLSLIRRSAAENAQTVVSIFVNPTQFSDPRDLARYPRDLAADTDRAAEAGADLIFAPTPEVMYPPGFSSTVDVANLSPRWEGEFRPGHFRGVATVVTILVNAVRPSNAYFGEKDYQQLTIVRRLHRDLVLPGKIVGCPTIRDADGLALSSRNARLTPDQREQAALVPQALFHIATLVESGQLGVASLLAAGHDVFARVPELSVDYLAIVDPDSLEPLDVVTPGARTLVAVRLGEVRLIDNLELPAYS